MSWCVKLESSTFAAIRGVVEKDRMGRGALRDRMADITGEKEADVKHEGWVWQYRRARAEVTVLH